ncbi:MAG: hypothetical protein U0269_25945 [Polyangiales bacterium]
MAVQCVLAASLGCGAKTGLRVPCEYETVRTAPTVAVLEARSTTTWGNQTHGGLLLAEASLLMWERLLPQLDGVAVLGGTWQPALGAPFSLANERPPVCTAWPELLVPYAERNSERVLTLYRDLRPRTGPDANVAALDYVVDSLVRAAPAHSPKWVLMQSNGLATCETSRVGDPNPAVAAPHFAAALRRGVKVLLIAVLPRTMGADAFSWEGNVGAWADALEAWSVAGGAVRRNGPAHYWYWTETDAIAAGVRENIIAPYFCELRTSVPASDRERVELLTEDGAAISRSTGWQWIDAGSTQLRVLGADCDRLVDRRATVRFVSRSSLCEI